MSSADKAEPPSIELQYAVSGGQYHPDEQQLLCWARTALQTETAGLTLRIVDEQEIQSLNATYRDKNQATNVLSFPADYPPEISLPYLGDILICAAVVNTEAVEQGKPAEAHWAHMVIHGVLHLRGYDHIEEEDAERMERLETELLGELGFSDPYLDLPPSLNRVGHV